MKSIGSLLEGIDVEKQYRKPPKRTSERSEILGQFLERLNPEREKMGIKPMTYPHLATMFQGLTSQDLYYLLSVCNKAKNFHKKFWWEISMKNHKKP